VESVPGKVSGAWVFRGTRLPVATVFENLEDGMSIEEIMEQFDVTRNRSQRYWILQPRVDPLKNRRHEPHGFPGSKKILAHAERVS
jgi:hypothetical protein